MTISLLWLNDYFSTDLTTDQLSDALTSIGLEVEKVETRDSVMGGLAGIIAGHVLTCEKHPDADRLSVTTVDVGGDNPATIVCGANNIAAGQNVWVALPETTLYDSAGKPWMIKVSKIRGVVSEGMICAEDELGLGTNHDGIMILPDATHPGTRASDYYKVTSDTIFEIGLTPNRSDATSFLGVAEDLAAYLSVQTKSKQKVAWPEHKDVPVIENKNGFKVTVRNTEACPRYSGVVISNLHIGPSPDWIQKRLQSIGIKTINNVVDITNFVLHEMGQPLHAFDADKISGGEIIVETKPSGTPFLALDGQNFQLYYEDLMICDGEGKPMCIGGVYGGLNSGVSDGTSTIFLESAHFNAGWVRRTSMRHNLRTEAARRFEKGSDPNITLKALARAVDLMTMFAGGMVASPVFDIYPQPIFPKQITLQYARLNAVTGHTIQVNELDTILEALHMHVVERHDHKVTVTVPTNKADVTREIDVIEEILRIYGFSNIPLPGRMITSVAIEPRFTPHKMRRLLGNFLAARGFSEAMNMSLTQPGYYRHASVMERAKWVTIHNTSNESVNLLRPDMLIPTLETIKRNFNRKQDSIRLFEFGKSYWQSEGNPHEKEHLFVALAGKQHADHWQAGAAKAVDFYSLKSEVNAILDRLGVKPALAITIEPDEIFAYGLEYRVDSHPVVKFGAVAHAVRDQFDIRQSVFIADFDFELLIRATSNHHVVYDELNKYPSVERDLAIVIPATTHFTEVEKVALKAGGNWLTNVQVFDLYSNSDQLGSGKVSMALRFTIENKEATLNDRDIDQWFTSIQKAFIKELQAEIRR